MLNSSETAYFRFEDSHHDRFVIKLTDPQKIQHARNILNRIETHKVHVSGTIIKQAAEYNSPWSYHLDPNTINFFELAIEVCDSSIRYIEENLSSVGGDVLPNNGWCPWSSKMIDEIEMLENTQTTPVIVPINKFNVNLQSTVTACDFSSDDKFAVIGYIDGMLRLWDLNSGQLLLEKKSHSDKITGVKSLRNSNSIITCGDDSKLYRRNASTLEVEIKFAGHNRAIAGVCISSDEKILYTFSSDLIKVWDIENGRHLKDIHFGTEHLAITTDGTLGVSAINYQNRPIHIWLLDLELGRSFKYASRPYPVHTIDINKELSLVAYDGNGRPHEGKHGVTLWNYETGTFKEFEAGGETVVELHFSPTNKNYLLAACSDSLIRLWDVSTQKLLAFSKMGSPVIFSKFSANGNNILSYTKDGTLTFSKINDLTLTNRHFRSKTMLVKQKKHSAFFHQDHSKLRENSLVASNIDLGIFGKIEWRQNVNFEYDIWISLSAIALDTLQKVYDVKNQLGLNELSVQRIYSDVIDCYIEDQAKQCSIFGRASGEVIAKFKVKSKISYSRGTLSLSPEIHDFDTTSSGSCTLVGAALDIWRSWFTSHFYKTINNNVPNIIRQENLPVESIYIQNEHLVIYAKTNVPEIRESIIHIVQERLNGVRPAHINDLKISTEEASFNIKSKL